MDAFRRPSFSELLDELEDIAESLEPPDPDLTTGWGCGVTVYPQTPPGACGLQQAATPKSYTAEELYTPGPIYSNTCRAHNAALPADSVWLSETEPDDRKFNRMAELCHCVGEDQTTLFLSLIPSLILSGL